MRVAPARLSEVTAALALPLHFHVIYELCKANLPEFSYLGLVPAVCALPAFAGLVWLLKKLPADNEGRNALLALFGGVALFFITLIFFHFQRYYFICYQKIFWKITYQLRIYVVPTYINSWNLIILR